MKLQKLIKDTNYWSRKVHIHLGLFLLLFIWLFSISGLLLNHDNWEISSFWEEREENKSVTAIQIPSSHDSVTVLWNIMSQLNLRGEITNVERWPDSLHFRISVPGQVRSLRVDYKKGICTQEQLKYNMAGIIRTLHTFNGVNKENADAKPNWLITRMWSLSMDGIAIGLIMLCISSWIMWFKIRERYSWGWIVLTLGFSGAIYFVFVIAML